MFNSNIGYLSFYEVDHSLPVIYIFVRYDLAPRVFLGMYNLNPQNHQFLDPRRIRTGPDEALADRYRDHHQRRERSLEQGKDPEFWAGLDLSIKLTGWVRLERRGTREEKRLIASVRRAPNNYIYGVL